LYALASAGFQPGEPAWKHWRRFDSMQLPPATRHWLLDEGSLTARLQAACGDRLRVRVLRQAWQRPRASERRALGLGAHEIALVREVLLECAGEPWVFARSIMPAATLHGRLRHLRRFGERSLGALLFSSRGLRRDPFEVALVDAAHAVLPAAQAQAGPVWGRRSVFRVHGRPLLVAEFFLPACRLGSL
jgi:chorismate lyase